MTNQVRAIADLEFYKGELAGYEIHMGRTYFANGTIKIKNAFMIFERSGEKVMDNGGAVSSDGNVIGTYIHGIFDNDGFRHAFLDYIRQKKGSLYINENKSEDKNKSGINWDTEYNKLADLVRRSIDMNKLYEIVNKWYINFLIISKHLSSPMKLKSSISICITKPSLISLLAFQYLLLIPLPPLWAFHSHRSFYASHLPHETIQ